MEFDVMSVRKNNAAARLNPTKLNEYSDLCHSASVIRHLDHEISAVMIPPKPENDNCGVQLHIPAPYVLEDSRIKAHLENLYIIADTVIMANSPDGARQIVTFDLNNIWTEHKEEPMNNVSADLNIKTNVVKKSWRVDAYMELKPSIAYQYTVSAESETAARVAAMAVLPSGFTIQSIAETAEGDSAVDLTDTERI